MSEQTYDWIGVIMLILAVFCIFLVAEQRDQLKAEAVKRGFAEWYIVDGTRETEFKWKEK
jgi:hypothetical protein